MSRILVLDPTAPPPQVSADPGPEVGALAGKVVGLRYDRTWQSYLHVMDEWAPALTAAGATLRWWNAGNRIGEGGERTRKELEEFADSIDLAVVGLGN